MVKRKQISIDEHIRKLKRYEMLMLLLYLIIIIFYIFNIRIIANKVIWSFYELTKGNPSTSEVLLKLFGGIICVLIPIIGIGVVLKYHKYVSNKIENELKKANMYKRSKKGE